MGFCYILEALDLKTSMCEERPTPPSPFRGQDFLASSKLDDFMPTGFVPCPVCSESVPAESLNEHLDACFSTADGHT